MLEPNLAATGNADFGYFGGGTSPTVSTVDRIDYSSDTGTTPTRGSLSSNRESLAATGNTSFGYFGGSNPAGSKVDRIDYSNDTATAATKGPLSVARRNLSASSSRANAIPTENIVSYTSGTFATPNTGYFACWLYKYYSINSRSY